MRDTQLTYYANESQQRSTPIEKISLKGCEILPDVNISSKKYAIRLMIPSVDGMSETIIRCSTVCQSFLSFEINLLVFFYRKNNMLNGWLLFVLHQKVDQLVNHHMKLNVNQF
jgi:hypothetical protein